MKIFNKIGELILEIESKSFSGANLRNANLRDADLRNANLRNADFRNADFRNANLRNADFRGVDLRNADFSGANFRGSDLRGVDFRSADFRGVDLRNADLIIFQMDEWTAYITTDHIRIGCKSYTLSEWENFTDEEISNMHSKALDYWKDNKEVIISLCKRFNNKGE